jgi:hypothetical protein
MLYPEAYTATTALPYPRQSVKPLLLLDQEFPHVPLVSGVPTVALWQRSHGMSTQLACLSSKNLAQFNYLR